MRAVALLLPVVSCFLLLLVLLLPPFNVRRGSFVFLSPCVFVDGSLFVMSLHHLWVFFQIYLVSPAICRDMRTTHVRRVIASRAPARQNFAASSPNIHPHPWGLPSHSKFHFTAGTHSQPCLASKTSSGKRRLPLCAPPRPSSPADDAALSSNIADPLHLSPPAQSINRSIDWRPAHNRAATGPGAARFCSSLP